VEEGGPWLQIVAGKGLPSSWSLLLGGDTSRTPTMGAEHLYLAKYYIL
jgi:hypothetical protein